MVLKSAGVFSTDVAELPSAKDAARLLREPRVSAVGHDFNIELVLCIEVAVWPEY